MMPMCSDFDELTSIAKYFFQRHSIKLFLQKSVNMEIKNHLVFCVPKHERIRALLSLAQQT